MRHLLYFFPIVVLAQTVPGDSALLNAIHSGDLAAVRASLKSGAAVNARDSKGLTPLMHAGAYCSLDCMRALLAAGAEVNAVSDAGFTPLMWAVWDAAKLRLLIEKGANVNARAKDGNSALILARQNGISDAVPVLLRAGAADEDGMDAKSRPLLKMDRDSFLLQRGIGIEFMHLTAEMKPVALAVFANRGSAEPLRAILDAGADVNAPVEWITLSLPPISFAAFRGNSEEVGELLKRGANPNAAGSRGLTPLMAVAAAEYADPKTIDLLLSKGSEINARDEDGRTALDWALLQGETAAAKQLRAAGGKPLAKPSLRPSPVDQPRSPAEAVQKALALLEPIGANFFKTSGGCISCHNNSLPSLAAHKAAEHKMAVSADMLSHAEKAAISTWRPMEENLAVGASSVGGLVANLGYELVAMAEAGYPRNFTTDAAALSLLRMQRADGSWMIGDTRPPLGMGDIKFTALTVRSLKAYLPDGLGRERDAAISRGRAYLLKATPQTTQEQAFQVLGLMWSGAPAVAIRQSSQRLLTLQRNDGGWGQLPTMASDAYATGQALFALQAAHVVPSDPACSRGVDYLLRTQLPDGSWFVQTRALPFQPYRETGFPHGKSQFISAAATSWAVMALVPTVDAPKQTASLR